MGKIITVVPNICEGRDKKFIEKITEKLNNIKNLVLLDVSMDNIRNRTVFSFTGPKTAIFEGGYVLYDEALKHIDMRKHQGEYPRIGAVDVFPFVPIKGVSIEEAVEISKEFAKTVAEKFNIPVFLFSESAQSPMRKELENIRKGEYEGLQEKLKDPVWRPDFGPTEIKPDFGATIIGARYPLLSFKVFINTTDIKTIKSICRSVQFSYGGLSCVKAFSGINKNSGLGQISISISNFRQMPMYRVLEYIKTEGKRYGVNIVKVEMIGLIPEIVFLESALYYMQIQEFSFDRLLENSIQKHLGEKIFIFE
jgi:glutamate formiminotransferase